MLTYVLQYTCFNKNFTYVRRQAKRCLHYYESATHHFTMQGCVSAKAIVTGKSSFLPLTFKIVWAADSQLASNVIISYVPPLLPYALGGKRRGSATTSLVHRPETGSSQAERHCCGSASFWSGLHRVERHHLHDLHLTESLSLSLDEKSSDRRHLLCAPVPKFHFNMREIVHIQAGQCGNQIGAKVSYLSNHSTVIDPPYKPVTSSSIV